MSEKAKKEIAEGAVGVAKAPRAEEEKKDEKAGDVEAEPKVVFEPAVDLPAEEEVNIESGTENSVVVLKTEGKLYAFDETLLDKGTGKKSLKSRGTGALLMVQQDEMEGSQCRVLMRQKGTGKVKANHLIDPKSELLPFPQVSHGFIWVGYNDTSDDTDSPKHVTFCFDFKIEENKRKFKSIFVMGKAHNQVVRARRAVAAAAEAEDGVAGLKAGVAGLKVDDGDEE